MGEKEEMVAGVLTAKKGLLVGSIAREGLVTVDVEEMLAKAAKAVLVVWEDACSCSLLTSIRSTS